MGKIKITMAVLLLVVGASVLCYPWISNYFAEQNMTKAIQNYKEETSKYTKEEIELQFQLATDYNNSIKGNPVKDPFIRGSGTAIPDNYDQILNYNGIMGYIEIPKININIPIYHGVMEEVLKKSVGHISESAFPIGGEECHPILAGHRGLPEAKIFTDLDQLELGDYFFINVLDKKLAYKVDQIKVVEPEDTGDLKAEVGKDYITLLTCTPLGINSHRILVRGERTEVVEEMEEIIPPTNNQSVFLWGTVLFVGILVIVVMIFFIRRGRKQ
ncbi:MAG: class C sortase [Eubacteriaceae bacterium]